MDESDNPLIRGLLQPDAYPHPCQQIELLETHISWILLTGLRAYKIKKPVDLGFADFTTLERRQHFCHEELRLNSRLAPELYLRVVPITGSVQAPRIQGSGPVLDYAVQMVQFSQDLLLSGWTASQFTDADIDNIADRCAAFHTAAEIAPADSRFGTPEHVVAPVRDNFDALPDLDDPLHSLVQTLARRTAAAIEQLNSVFANRKQQQRVRECHGDLHLGNMLIQDQRVLIFDGIDFNEDLRWLDVINDIGFLVMDLEEKGWHQLANRLLNRWLERTGDYAGMQVLAFYCAYRAAVRAKVLQIRRQQDGLTDSERNNLDVEVRKYLQLAVRYTETRQPALLITTGPSGSGKTTVTQQLIADTAVIRVRSDVERKRLHGLAFDEASSGELKSQMYSAAATAATYNRLLQLAETVIRAGYPVVVDATFSERTIRNQFQQLASRLQIPFVIIRCSADPATLKQRLQQRQRTAAAEASEADEAVLTTQLETLEPLSQAEKKYAIDADARDLTSAVRKLLQS